MQTCFQLVWMAAERTPNHLAMVDDQNDRAFTYAELIEEIEIVAAGLSARGVVKGTRIATALPGTFDHAIVLLALQRLGAVPALLNFRLTPGDIAGLIEDGDIRGAIVLPDEAVVSAVADVLPDTAMILSVGSRVGVGEDYAACRGDRTALGPLPDFER
ncbi:MAG: AMP-binding protein, partial [Proteobacteria bacterium]|nr:AMP-binding protein [Pseudomonadota bacterium]